MSHILEKHSRNLVSISLGDRDFFSTHEEMSKAIRCVPFRDGEWKPPLWPKNAVSRPWSFYGPCGVEPIRAAQRISGQNFPKRIWQSHEKNHPLVIQPSYWTWPIDRGYEDGDFPWLCKRLLEVWWVFDMRKHRNSGRALWGRHLCWLVGRFQVMNDTPGTDRSWSCKSIERSCEESQSSAVGISMCFFHSKDRWDSWWCVGSSPKNLGLYSYERFGSFWIFLDLSSSGEGLCFPSTKIQELSGALPHMSCMSLATWGLQLMGNLPCCTQFE